VSGQGPLSLRGQRPRTTRRHTHGRTSQACSTTVANPCQGWRCACAVEALSTTRKTRLPCPPISPRRLHLRRTERRAIIQTATRGSARSPSSASSSATIARSATATSAMRTRAKAITAAPLCPVCGGLHLSTARQGRAPPLGGLPSGRPLPILHSWIPSHMSSAGLCTSPGENRARVVHASSPPASLPDAS